MRRFQRFRVLGAASLLAAALCAAPASAAQFVVGQLTDSTGSDCAVVAASECSLREAVQAANTNGDDVDTILLADGTHLLSTPGTAEDLNATGDIDILQAGVVIRPASATGRVVVNAQSVDRVFHALAGSSVISDLTITGGQADPSAGGGGIRTSNSGTQLRLERVALTGNRAGIFGNQQRAGGGIVVGPSTVVSIVQSTVSGNSATAGGGGISVGEPPALVRISGSTITGNTADSDFTVGTLNEGGGLLAQNGGAVIVRDTVIAGNIDATQSATPAPAFPDCFFQAGTAQSEGGNVVGHSGCAPLGPVTADPRLGPLADNGGRTDTHAPLPGSPVVDAGNAAGCAEIGGAPGVVLTLDALGVPRQGACDAGAVEARPDLVVESVTPSAEPVTTGGDVTYAVVVRNQGAGPAQNASAQLIVPAGAGIVGASSPGGCAADTCALGALAPGAAAQASFTVRTSAAGTFTVAALTQGLEPVRETNLQNNTLNRTTSVTDPPPAPPAPSPAAQSPTPPTTTSTAAVLPSLGSPTVVSRPGSLSLRVRVACPRTSARALCTGALRLEAPPARRGGRATVLARTRYSVAKGRAKVVTLSPNAAARRIISRRSPLRARIVAVPDGRGSRTTSRAVTLRA